MGGDYLVLPRWAFTLWWLLLLAMHAVIASYNAAYALFYLELNGTYLNTVLEFFSLGMPAQYHRRISLAYSIMAALHALCLLLMIAGSIWHRQLRFSIDLPRLRWAKATTTRDVHNSQQQPSTASTALHYIYDRTLGRTGIFGVDSPHFHRVLILHEVVETLLQSIQAYRMSAVLPRVRENRFYVILLVLNCCAPLIIHHFYKHNEPRMRFANLMCDCVLDLVVSVGIPALIVLTYVGQYDSYIKGFPTEYWYNDNWVAHVQNEFQLVLVVSWKDLFSRVIFSWGILSTSTSMKELIAYAEPKRVGVRPPQPKAIKRTQSSGPSAASVVNAVREASHVDTLVAIKIRQQLKVKNVYYAFVAWGLLVLGFHIHAESRPQLPQCLLQVRPWGVARPSCYLVELNCHRLQIEGLKSEVIDQWGVFDHKTVVQLLIRHCPMFEMPPIVQEFKNLNGFKVYNSTIAEWKEDAAFTATHHKQIITVYMIRVNLTDGVIPDGLLSRDFPPTLIDFEIVVSNLRELPDDIDEIWPFGSSVYIEYGKLTSVPASLIRLQPYYMSVCGNPIKHLPAELFEIPNLLFLHAGGTQITDLPHNVTAISPALMMVYVYDTNVSTFWSWIDPLVNAPGSYIIGHGSKYCRSLNQYLESGNDSSFIQDVSLSYDYSVLMFPANYSELITSHVLCMDAYATSLYPLVSEDSNSAISPV